MQFFSYAHLLI